MKNHHLTHENEQLKQQKYESDDLEQKALAIFENELSDDEHLQIGEKKRRGFEKSK